MSLAIAGISAAIWIYLIAARGAFWRASVRDDASAPAPLSWPHVTAVIPARNEVDVIAQSLHSLLTQDYPGSFDVILVDDQSRDGTCAVAAATAANLQAQDRLTIVSGRTLPAGWVGKVWAMKQGVDRSENLPRPPA